MKEVWADIKGYEGSYKVSNFGRVKSMKYKKDFIRKNGNNGNGYLFIPLSKNGNVTNHYIHRLVAIAFISNPQNKATVNHIDGNKQNNYVGNLEWATQSENSQHGFDNNLIKQNTGKDNPCSTPVLQYSLKGNFVAKYNSIREAYKATGVLPVNIGCCCMGKYKRAGDFQWRYYSVGFPKKIAQIPNKKGNGEKSVLQFSKEGVFIKRYNSIREAESIIGRKIGDCLRRRTRTAGGYKWEYENK